jgi:myosin heavy subunit
MPLLKPCRLGSALLFYSLRALDFFQWKGNKLEILMQALGIILLFGNIVFAETPDDGCVVLSLDDLIVVADALGIPVDVLHHAMTHQVIQTSRERVAVPLRPDVAKDYLDALSKKIYALCIFESVVSTINELTHSHDADVIDSQTPGIISLLDIYGA